MVIKHYISFLLLALFLISLIPSSAKSATSGTGNFGGYVAVMIPCTCSSGYWLFMSPLFQDSTTPAPGALIWSLSTRAYAQNITPPVPTMWLLGKYQSGGQCRIIAGTTCVTLPTKGTITESGMSFPGGGFGSQ
jgi:hypothetical protein